MLPEFGMISFGGECHAEKCFQNTGSGNKEVAAAPVEAWMPNLERFRINLKA